MTQARIGSKVRIRYTGKFKNGKLFDVSCSHEPIEFTLGHGEVLQDFEKAVLGMKPGESKIVTLPPREGSAPQGANHRGGRKPKGHGTFDLCTIKGVKKDAGSLDRSYALKGRTLVFDVQLVDVS
jgi:hypothetical protein